MKNYIVHVFAVLYVFKLALYSASKLKNVRSIFFWAAHAIVMSKVKAIT